MRRTMLSLVLLALCAQSQAEDQKPIENFIKLKKNETGEITGLFTPVIRYTAIEKSGEGVTPRNITLDIIGAVHVGETSYYQELNEHFKNYDAVLYELVAPDNKLVPDTSEAPGLIPQLAKQLLQLDHQLRVIDYKAKNFVHADFTHAELKEAMAKNGDDAMTIGGSFLIEVMRKQNKAAYLAKNGIKPDNKPAPTLDIDLMALFGGDQSQALKIKRMMAEQLAQPGAELGFGSAVGTYLVDKRNDDALETLRQEMKTKVNLALFYGAAHIPDFDKKLRAEGFTRGETKWLLAWNMKPKAVHPVQNILNSLNSLNSLFKGMN